MLGCATIVGVIGISALTLVRIERIAATDASDFAQARLNARAGVELGLLRISDDPNWRANYPNGLWETDQPIGSGTYSIEGIDPNDGDLTNSDDDSLTLTGIGAQGEARYRLQVILVPEADPLSCLEVSLHAQNDASFNSATLNGDQTISANNNVTESGSTINSDVEAVNAITGTGYNGKTTSGITPRAMPDQATVFDYYVTNGTSIAVPGCLFEDRLLSPASNPFGPVDSRGIYVVDCLGQNVTITNSRIVGTLVLLNAGPNSQIKPAVNLEPAVANLPTLLVAGNLTVDSGSSLLSESSTAVNFNPVGTPYQGLEDGDTNDTYPAVVTGLVYVSGTLTTSNNAAFEGVVVVGNTFAGAGNVTLTYSTAFFNNPPPGFRSAVQMRVATGSWRHMVD